MLFFLTNLSFLDCLREANLPGFFCPPIRVRVISMPWKKTRKYLRNENVANDMILWCVLDYQAVLSLFDQIVFHEFVLLLFIYIMHVQSHIVYKLMTVRIVLVPVIKDVKIVQLCVLQVYFFLNILFHQ